MSARHSGARTRGNLVSAAAEIFDRDGFTGASLHEVCERAEVTKGALYCHFPSKNALAVAVIERQSLLWHQLREELATDGGSPVQALVDLSFAFAERISNDPVVRVGSRLVLDAELFDVAAAGQFAGWITVVKQLLCQARQAGELRAQVDIAEAAEGIVAELTGAQLISQAMTGRCELTSRLPAMWRSRLLALVTDETRRRLRTDGPYCCL